MSYVVLPALPSMPVQRIRSGGREEQSSRVYGTPECETRKGLLRESIQYCKVLMGMEIAEIVEHIHLAKLYLRMMASRRTVLVAPKFRYVADGILTLFVCAMDSAFPGFMLPK